MSPEFFSEVWSTLKSYIPVKERDDAAMQLVSLYDEYMDIDDLRHLESPDKHLDAALSEFFEDE